ncbi:MAG: hypothetical protein GY715_07745, partial [Planctomycetes bacterium]|nr:hypothetical protein [Planctomycetota bacterium]
LAARLDTSTPVVDLLREGSVLARCDFSGLRPRGMQRLCPDDLAGMRDLLCLLLVDARRLLARGGSEEEVVATIVAAADRLAICYRMVAHLGGDDAMLSALVAHDAFRRTHAIVEGAFEAGAFGETHRATLFAAADRIARKDPFGYINSVVAGRQMLVTLAGKQIVTEARAKELRERVRIADGEQILHVLAVHDTMIRASHRVPPDTTPSLDPLDRMDGIISRPALDAVRSYVPRVGPQIARGAIDFYCGREIPTIGRVAARRQRARSDLRDGLRRLKPPAPAASTPPAASTRDPGPSPAQPTPAERTGSR